MAAFRAYTGNPVFVGADFYIHKRKEDIGKAANGSQLSDKDIAMVFSRQKEQAGEAAKTFYKELFLENLKLNQNSLQLINSIFEDDTDTMLTEIDKQLKNKLQQAINQDELGTLMALYKDSSKQSKDLLSGTRQATAAFNKILQNIADASLLINGDLGPALASVLVYYKEHGNKKMSLEQMGQNLSMAIYDFVRAYPYIPLEEAKIYEVLMALDSLSKTFTTGKTTTNNDVVSSNIADVVDAMFSKGFSEVVGSQLNSVAGLAINKELAKIKGSDTVQVQKSDIKGYLTELDGGAYAGKTDYEFPNVSVSIDKTKATPEGGDIKMNIGISNKFYRSSAFPGGTYDGQKIHFSSGSGGTIKEVLSSLLETDLQHYLAYNTLFQSSSGLPAATIALQDIILTRQITRLFATRGGVKDFSQYVIVNGQVVSIWDLLQYATNRNVGLSQSMDKGGSQAIVLHIRGRTDIFEYSNESNARIRVPNVNKAINKATVIAEVRMEKLITAIPATDAIPSAQ